ncbi:leucyl aminopeptidase, partial [bacterium]|nr:leucyl aminopeptidase [bacterium]
MRFEGNRSVSKAYKEAVVVPLFENAVTRLSWIGEFDSALHKDIAHVISKGDFKGKQSAMLTLYRPEANFKRVVLVGAGKKREFNLEKLRKLVASVDTAVQQFNVRGYTMLIEPLLPLSASDYIVGKACAEAIVLSRFEFDAFKSKQEKTKKDLNVVFWGAPRGDFNKGIQDGVTIGANVNFVREIVNTPSNTLTPAVLAEKAQAIARELPGLSCTVFDKNKIEELGMNGIISVAKGSICEPKFIILEYDGAQGKQGRPIVAVGKGVTFDTGGISLKPCNGMEKMKYDMGGAGAVIGFMKSAVELKLPYHLVGIIPTVENMPSASAYKPGDVITMASGKTVEVLSTDAEGRLILADALDYAVKNYNPSALFDLATLTGACMVALGNKAVALMGNNRGIMRKAQQYAENSGERVWELPLWDDYSEMIKSDVADIKNTGGPGAGTITAGAFLKEFVGNTPWIHMDIASTAWMDTTERGYLCKGATGVG